jgi:glycine cleavage system pyridoxal-binding protein P
VLGSASGTACYGHYRATSACRDGTKRSLPGASIAASVDDAPTTYRLALQTRRQHIRHESHVNICTAQVRDWPA